MAVHDELVFEVKASQVTGFIVSVKQRMRNAAEFRVPLIAEAEPGANWDEAH